MNEINSRRPADTECCGDPHGLIEVARFDQYQPTEHLLGLHERPIGGRHLAVSYSGELALNDPDGIVVDARFVPWDAAELHLEGCRRWVAEPLVAWLAERRPAREAREAQEAGLGGSPARAGHRPPKVDRSYRYRLEGDDARRLEVVRL